MDPRDIQDAQLMERYLQGKLSAEEEQAFEEAYLADSALLDELVLTEKLQQGFKSLETPRLGEVPGRAGAGRPGRLRVLGSPQYAAAASVLLGLSLLLSTGLFLDNQELRESAGMVAGEGGVTRLVPLLTVRGTGATEVEPPVAGEWTVFLLDTAFTQYDDYRATLTRVGANGAETVRQLDGLSPTYDGFIALGLPGQTLSPGEYDILLEGRMREWPADRGFEQVARAPVRIAPPR
jgi:hypothetical protein